MDSRAHFYHKVANIFKDHHNFNIQSQHQEFWQHNINHNINHNFRVSLQQYHNINLDNNINKYPRFQQPKPHNKQLYNRLDKVYITYKYLSNQGRV